MVDGSAHSEATIQARRAALGLGVAPGAKPVGDLRAPRTVTTPTTTIQTRDRAIFIAFIAMTISVTFLQCFGIPVSDDANIAVAIPVIALSLAALCYFATPRINPLRLVLYVLFVIAAGGATGFFAERHSPASLALMVMLYAPFVFSFPTSEANFHRCMNCFSNVMVALAVAEFAQHAIQIAASPQAWPNLYQLVPTAILIPDFNYMQPLVWRSHYDKPQAFVFLEVSLLSQYLALALAIEIAMFQRVKRIALFTAGLFATFAGTGLLLIAVALPVLVGRMGVRKMLVVVAILLVVAGIAGEAGWLDTVGARLDELQKAGSSGNHRFMEPFDNVIDFLGKPGSLYSGIGAGQIEKGNGHLYWPLAKATIEYGLLAGALFYGYFIYALFDRPPSRPLAFTLLLWFSFEGTLLTAVYPITCVLLSSMFLIEHDRPTSKRRRASPPAVPGTAIEMRG
jgi:hypothetical protein